MESSEDSIAPNVPRTEAAKVLKALRASNKRREDNLNKYSSDHESSDDEANTQCPRFGSFYAEDGSQAILDMANFSASEFRELWNSLSGHIKTHWNVGRGRRCAEFPCLLYELDRLEKRWNLDDVSGPLSYENSNLRGHDSQVPARSRAVHLRDADEEH